MNHPVYWLIVEISANLFEALILFAVLETFFDRKFQNPWYYRLLPIVHMGLITLINALKLEMLPASLILIFVSFLYAYFMYNAKLRNAILLIVLYHALWFLTEICVVLVIGMIFTISMDDIFQQNLYRLTGIVVSKTIQFIILKFIQHYQFKSRFNLRTRIWLSLMVFPLATILTTFSWYSLGRLIRSDVIALFFTVSSLTMLYANFIIFNLFESSNRAMVERHLQDLVQMRTANEIKRLHQLQESHNQIRQFAHDLRNKLIPLNVLINENKRTEALDYLHSLHGSIIEDKFSIESGNLYIDALLNQKSLLSEKYGIKFTCNLDECSSINFPSEDLCVIIGNALDNAIEACQKIQNSDMRKIACELIKYRQTFMIKISNPVENPPIIENGQFKTSKKDTSSHGLGLKSVRRIVDRYNGYLTLNVINQTFEFCAMLPL